MSEEITLNNGGHKYMKIDGGIGRCISATGALIACKEDLSIVTSFASIFDHILDRPYPMGTHYLYEDHIVHGDYQEPEPYNSYKFYRENKHIAQVYNFLINGVDEYVAPKMKLSPSEKEFAKDYIGNIRVGKLKPQECTCDKCKDKTSDEHDKPKKIKKKDKVMLLQPYARSGGTRIPDESFRSIKPEDLEKIVEAFEKEYSILLVVGNGQATCSDTIPFQHNEIRRIIAVIPYVDAVLCCDSFLHHAVAALDNPVKTVVLWGGTNELNFGYKEQVNLRVKDIEVEPNRVPHNHSYYVQKNEGCNDFLPLLPKIKAVFEKDVKKKESKDKRVKNKEEAKRKEVKRKEELKEEEKVLKRIEDRKKKEKADGSDNDNSGKRQSTKDNSDSEVSGTKADGNGCRNCRGVHKRETVKAGA